MHHDRSRSPACRGHSGYRASAFVFVCPQDGVWGRFVAPSLLQFAKVYAGGGRRPRADMETQWQWGVELDRSRWGLGSSTEVDATPGQNRSEQDGEGLDAVRGAIASRMLAQNCVRLFVERLRLCT